MSQYKQINEQSVNSFSLMANIVIITVIIMAITVQKTGGNKARIGLAKSQRRSGFLEKVVINLQEQGLQKPYHRIRNGHCSKIYDFQH